MTLQENKPTRNYSSTQAELYAICNIGLESFREHIANFSNFKGYYNNAWANQFEDEIIAARKLPSAQQRGELSETANIQLKEKGDECLIAWQRLKRHIADVQAWQNMQKPKLEAAGQLLYDSASNGNWANMQELMDDGESFITDNLAALKANQNMPAPFQAQFTTLKNEFDTLYNTFTDAEQDEEQGTTEKINANNNIYSKLIGMFKDGQEIYRNDRATQERFIFDQVLKIVRGSKGKTITIDLAPSAFKQVSRVVSNSKITNTGSITLFVAVGLVETIPPTATQLNPGTAIDVPNNSKEITIFNNSTDTAGQCTVRITVD